MTAKDITLDLIIRYGFQILGALIILIVGVILARWIGNLTNRWLEPRVKEPPMRLLIVRVIRILVLALTLLVALDKFGFQIAPLVAAVGVAGEVHRGADDFVRVAGALQRKGGARPILELLGMRPDLAHVG